MDTDKKKKRTISKIKVFWIIILFLSIILAAFSFYSLSNRPVFTQEYDVIFRVGDRVGLDLRTDSLAFGMLTREGTATRDVLITNTFQYDVNLNILADSIISEYIEAPDGPLLINSGQNASVPITVRIPFNASYGNYSGKVYLIFYKNR